MFIAGHYAALSLFVFACWGAGQLVLHRLLAATSMQRWLAHGLSTCCGIGIVICALQWLAVAGLLLAPVLLALLAVGLTAATWQASWPFGSHASRHSPPATKKLFATHWTVWLLLLLGLGTTLFPLRPPHMWDELMYHLPHAQAWAQTGRLQVNEWLRYPWAPFNYHLLYAAALVLLDDVMPHLLHALAGWLTALLLYQLATRYMNRIVACIAATAWLFLVRLDFGNAYIDLAVAAFLLAGLTSFLLWWESAASRSGGWLLAAAFFLGVAAGTKYQTLGLLPFFAVAVLLRERRPKVLLMALGAGLLPCAYWYVRNALQTGDPFDPLGGNVFGFHDWNASDMRRQLLDLSNVRNWPPSLVWPAIAAPLVPLIWRTSSLRIVMLFCGYAFAVWLATSHFARYLLPSYPLLLLLSGSVAYHVAFSLFTLCRKHAWSSRFPSSVGAKRFRQCLVVLLVGLSVLTTGRSLSNDWPQVAVTPTQRDLFLARELSQTWETTTFLRGLDDDARIYQNGMEGAIYYAPHPIWGDHFGPWRYEDFVNLSPAELAARLSKLKLNTLVLRLQYNHSLRDNPTFAQCFLELGKNQSFAIFRVAHWRKADGSDETCRPAKVYPFVVGPSVADHP